MDESVSTGAFWQGTDHLGKRGEKVLIGRVILVHLMIQKSVLRDSDWVAGLRIDFHSVRNMIT
jgi:hypothetical protein